MRFLGLDIGGANIKLATHDGIVQSVPFAIWKQPQRLSEVLASLATGPFADANMIGVTMTAELADCFETRAAGVRHVIESVGMAFPRPLVRYWLTTGEFASSEVASEFYDLVAAANWHALATWAARAVPQGPALLIDVGSTTTDVIPIQDGMPASAGLNDLERLMHGELVYTGAARTPLCAITNTVQLQGKAVPVAAEFFATTLDLALILNEVADDAQNCETADGRPAMRQHALNRLAHLLCCDATELPESELVAIAVQIRRKQLEQIAAAVRSRLQFLATLPSESGNTDDRPTLLVSGSGCDLAMRAIEQLNPQSFGTVMNLSRMWRTDVSECACAFAVARLVSERCLDDLLPLDSF